MTVDEQALAASLRRLSRSGSNSGVLAALNEVADACVDLFSVTGSGILLADEQNMVRYVASSDGPGRVLEEVECETGEGPCTAAFVNNELVASTDLRAESQWPRLASAVAPYSVRAVLGVPVRLGAIPVGTLDVYRDVPHAWEESECAALLRYSQVVQTTLTAALAASAAGELADQLQYALDYRVTIERGVGYLMARDGVDAITAFNRLRRAARNTRTKIGGVAEHLLTTGSLPGR